MRRTLSRYALIAAPFLAIGAAGAIGLVRTGDALAQPTTGTALSSISLARPPADQTAAVPRLHLFATDCSGAGLAANPLLPGGAPLVIDVDGFAPNATVTVRIAGQPTPAATQQADAAGEVRTLFHVPFGLAPGQHVLTLTGPTTEASTAYPFWTADAQTDTSHAQTDTSHAQTEASTPPDCDAPPPPPLAP